MQRDPKAYLWDAREALDAIAVAPNRLLKRVCAEGRPSSRKDAGGLGVSCAIP